MREYTLSQALNQDAAHAFSGFRRVASNWLKRRRLRRIEDMDDHLLSDIGINRDDLRSALHLPLTVDPIWELHRQSRRRDPGRGRRQP